MNRKHSSPSRQAHAGKNTNSQRSMQDQRGDQIIYETPEPFEDMVSGPLWFYLLVGVALVAGSFYLGRHMGSLDTRAHNGFLHAPASQDAQPAFAQASAVSGAAIYTSRCVSCHQASGQGVPGAFPPLVKSHYVLGDPEILLRIVLQGLQGEVQVEGQTYNGLMPPWQDQLSDEEVAAVASHIRSELGGNSADKVDAALVKHVREASKDRQKPWTVQELEALGK
ncbi:c-type cytochrome [Methylobacillus pratensis]